MKFAWIPATLLFLALAACSSGDGESATPAPPADTPAPATASPATEPSPTAVAASDALSHLPSDPKALMLATLNRPLAEVGLKMAYSGNKSFIPVLMEFMRFQRLDDPTPVSSFMSRIKDGVSPDEDVIFPQEERRWSWWLEWLGQHPEVVPPEGYAGWKGSLYSFIDPKMGAFLYDGVKTEIRLEEIAWGGVVRDGIPDLTNAPVLPAEAADYLNPDDRVFGVSINGEHRAYPLRILNPHEMANDVVGGVPFALAY